MVGWVELGYFTLVVIFPVGSPVPVLAIKARERTANSIFIGEMQRVPRSKYQRT